MAQFIDVKFKVDTAVLRQKLKNQQKAVEKLPVRAEQFFVSQTPIDKGNARRSTKLGKDNVIHANYAYAQRLDDGWSSQSPQGMTKPTEKWLEKEFKKIFKK
jgi:hypothetical protein